MSDTPDPFAARPYVPPAEREADETAVNPPSEQPVEPAEPDVLDVLDVLDVSDQQAASPVEPETTLEPEFESHADQGAGDQFTARFADEPAPPAPEPPARETTETSVTEPPPPPSQAPSPDPAPGDTTPLSPASTTDTGYAPTHSTATYAGSAETGSPAPPSSGPPYTGVPMRPDPPRESGHKLGSALAVAALAAVAGFGGAAGYQALSNHRTGINSALDAPMGSSDRAPKTAVEAVAAKIRPSVVQINFRSGDEGGSGTGIIISSNGEIMTNNHVVEDAAKKGSLVAVFSDGSHAKAKILGRDPATDIAVIKVKGRNNLTPATLGTSADLRVGEGVVVVGSPYGLESTVTSGIVSALNRPVVASHGDGQEIIPSFQSDAAINLGNSGGPVLDLQGRVVGVVAAIRASDTGGSIGLGFAIPIDVAKGVAKHLIKGEKVEHAQIGVTVSPAVASDEITKIGAEIRDVKNGSAGDKAGLKKGDIVTAVDGIPVASNDALVAAIRAYQPREKVTVTYQRGGQTKNTTVTLGSDGGNPPS